MSARNLTWQEVAVCLGLLGGVVVAYKMFGELPAGMLLVISGVVNLLLGRGPPKPPKGGTGGSNCAPLVGSVLGTVALLAAGCSGVRPTVDDLDAELSRLDRALARCRAEGRDSGSLAAYEACKKREGIQR